MRACKKAWRPLGYICNLKNLPKELIDDKLANAEHNSKCFHKILAVILKSLVDVQRNGGICNVDVSIGGITKNVNVKLPVGMIVGDIQGGDQHACRSMCYSAKMKRMCRQCTIHGWDSGNPLAKCNRISMHKVMKLVHNDCTDKLKAMSQHNVHSAWFDIDFGGCPYGIFSAAMPIEALHSMEGGLIKDILQIFFKIDLKDSGCARVDQLISSMCNWDKQHHLHSCGNKDMPRLLFKDGVTSLEKMASTQHVGQMLCILLLTLTDDGCDILKTQLKKSYNNPEQRMKNMQHVFSVMLCYWSWLKKDKFWKTEDTNSRKATEISIRKMLKCMVDLWPRDVGQGWHKPKLHEQIHVARDIQRNGSPRNSYSGFTESHHVEVKHLANRTQKIRLKQDKQLGDRVAESHIINLSHARMTSHIQNKQKIANDVTLKGNKFTFVLTQDRSDHSIHCTKWINSEFKSRTQVEAHHLLKHWFSQHHGTLGDNVPTFHTECNRYGQMFRADPKFRQGNAWYDWVMCRFEKSDQDKKRKVDYKAKNHLDEVYFGDDVKNANDYHYAPVKILAFTMIDGEAMLIGMCCHYQHKRSSTITTQWRVEHYGKSIRRPYVTLIHTDSIVRHCLMIPADNCNKVYQEVWSRELWAKEFA